MNFKITFFAMIMCVSLSASGLGENAYDASITGYGHRAEGQNPSTRARKQAQAEKAQQRAVIRQHMNAANANAMTQRQKAKAQIRKAMKKMATVAANKANRA